MRPFPEQLASAMRRCILCVAAHMQNVNAYHSRLRGWLSRFHGVATRHFPNCPGWCWMLGAGCIRSPETLLKATLGSFPYLLVTEPYFILCPYLIGEAQCHFRSGHIGKDTSAVDFLPFSWAG